MSLFRRRRRLVDGHAEIVEAWRPRPDGSSGNCRMKLLLDVPGIPPQLVDHHELLMTANRWPEAGMRVAVTVDADDPSHVDVHWDSVFGEMPAGLLGYGTEAIASVFGIDLDLSPGADRSDGGPAPGWEQRIAALNAQYAAGIITYDEMAAEIQRVLTGEG